MGMISEYIIMLTGKITTTRSNSHVSGHTNDKVSMVKCIVVLVILAAIAAVILINNLKMKKYIKENSAVLTKLDEINSKTKFLAVRNTYTYYERVDTLQKAKNFNYDKYIFNKLTENQTDIRSNIDNARSNKSLYDEYIDKVNNLQPYIEEEDLRSVSKLWKFGADMEKNMVKSKTLAKPSCEVKITINVNYTSPAGKSNCSGTRTFSQSEIADILTEIEYKQSRATAAQEERAKMTTTLRYKILKRDGYRCVLCGRGSKEGAELEVDHIKPVSKGGKTEESNLRTLCRECNRGKSDSYDEYGYN